MKLIARLVLVGIIVVAAFFAVMKFVALIESGFDPATWMAGL